MQLFAAQEQDRGGSRGTAVQDVVREQGLAEIRAKKALEELLRRGEVKKEGKQYFPARCMTKTARELLLDTLAAPRMFCSCKEALLARCSAVLELEGVVDPGFYERHLRVNGAGNNLAQAVAPYDHGWAERVIRDALSRLPERSTSA